MADVKLILSIPQGVITATSLGVEGLAVHRSPGSGKYFTGRRVFVELAMRDGRPDFRYLDEGGWRDAAGDTAAALAAVGDGKRTKTALSNNGFSCTPLSAYRRVFLVKTAGEVLELAAYQVLHGFASHECREEMKPDDVARTAGLSVPAVRQPRLYMVLSPIELLVLSNLTPEEYAWYSTHRPGKVFRQVVFAELQTDQPQLAALSRFTDARAELRQQPGKKTKTVVSGDNHGTVPYHSWVGYADPQAGGLYMAGRDEIGVWRFPPEIPRAWERATG
ncbi:MAG TPA: hypothetical protein PLL30_02315 [Candidatus Krumholzibacteria bacterium]|nr:hypothetical protein [Candidatus Krumholzibacteria bacterium]HPD70602.1 hypothetical protein [Candidatus Krumholzibacteria bacterium]HRY39698.1 hypothetical protein [Candidatus Krumholzibacteria bacterium]